MISSYILEFGLRIRNNQGGARLLPKTMLIIPTKNICKSLQ